MLEAILIGVIQGITEFLPVSSSGHIFFAGKMSIYQAYNLPLMMSIHFGTLLAILLYFRQRLKKMFFSIMKINDSNYTDERKLWVYLIIASIPAALAGILLEPVIEKISTNLLVGTCWIVNGIILIIGEILSKNKKQKPVNISSAFVVGIFQAIAILPGISRSGSTITAAKNTGMSPQQAFEFSFFLGMIAIFGGFLLEILKKPSGFTVLCLISGISSLVSGYFSLFILAKVLKNNKMKWFGLYTIIIGMSVFLFKFL